MDELARKHRRIVSEYLKPAVTEMGFGRYEHHGWRRVRGDVVERIGTHLRKVRGYSYAWIGVGIGVGYSSLADLLRQAPSWIGLGNLEAKAPSMMGGLIGYLDPDAKQNEWYVTEDANEDLIGQEILDAIQRVALPFWQKYGSIDAALKVWSLPPENLPKEASAVVDMYVSAIYLLRDEKAKALQHMERRVAELSEEYDKRMVNSLWNMIDERQAFLEFLKKY